MAEQERIIYPVIALPQGFLENKFPRNYSEYRTEGAIYVLIGDEKQVHPIQVFSRAKFNEYYSEDFGKIAKLRESDLCTWMSTSGTEVYYTFHTADNSVDIQKIIANIHSANPPCSISWLRAIDQLRLFNRMRNESYGHDSVLFETSGGIASRTFGIR